MVALPALEEVTTPDRLILDCGSKALAAERLTSLTDGYGSIEGHPRLKVARLYEEHAIVLSDGPCSILEVVPNHACATANLHSRMLVVEGGVVVDTWPVQMRGWRREDRARGALQAVNTGGAR